MLMPPIKEHDAEISVDFHLGLGILPPVSPMPPLPAKWWVQPAGARFCWLTDKTDGKFSTGAPSPNVYINNKRAIKHGHDIGLMIPHLPVPGLNSKASTIDLLLWLTIALSMAKPLLSSGNIVINDKPIAVGPWPIMNCGQPVPTILGMTFCFCDVKVAVKASDFLTAAIEYAIAVLIALIMNSIFKGGDDDAIAKQSGKRMSKRIAKRSFKTALKRTLKSAGKSMLSKRILKKIGTRIGGRAATYCMQVGPRFTGNNSSGGLVSWLDPYKLSNFIARKLTNSDSSKENKHNTTTSDVLSFFNEYFNEYINQNNQHTNTKCNASKIDNNETAILDEDKTFACQANILTAIIGMQLVGGEVLTEEYKDLASTSLMPPRPFLEVALEKEIQSLPDTINEDQEHDELITISQEDIDTLRAFDASEIFHDSDLQKSFQAFIQGTMNKTVKSLILYNEKGPEAFKDDLSRIGIPEALQGCIIS